MLLENGIQRSIKIQDSDCEPTCDGHTTGDHAGHPLPAAEINIVSPDCPIVRAIQINQDHGGARFNIAFMVPNEKHVAT